MAPPITKFPDLSLATDEGIVAIGGDLHPDSLMLAYRQGIFPWPVEGLPLTWFCPPERAILEFDRLHISRSLAKACRKPGLEITIDRAFGEVIRACSLVPRSTPTNDPEGHNTGTWIIPWMITAYEKLHALGHAHSVEAWRDGRLVAGLYGVDADGAFAGESMFTLENYASKRGLLHLIDHLQARGGAWIDIQQLTPHMEAMGARLLARDEFLRRLADARAKNLKLF